jgi:hypothetical protein
LHTVAVASGVTTAKLTTTPAGDGTGRPHEDSVMREERSMTARRMLAGLGLLLAACTTAACAQVVSGTGSAAPGIQGQVTASPSGSPTSSDDPSSSPSPSASSSSDSGGDDNGSGGNDGGGGNDTSAVCQALDKSAVESAVGSSVSFGRSSSSGCQIEAEDGRSMIVAVFDYLKLSEYKKPDTTDLTVAGHPAVKTPTTIIYVARSTNPDAAGIVAAYYAGLRDGGDAVATKVLEQVVPKFPK